MNTPQKPIRSIRRPARLELNNAGAWRILMTFDVTDPQQVADVKRVAAEMGQVYADLGGRMVWRLYAPMDQAVLAYWEPGRGWRDVTC